MSYTTPLKTPEFHEIVAGFTHAFFSQGYENTFHLPQSLRLGRRTFEAGKKLFSTKSLWFNDVDKTKYLIESPTQLNYHQYWGLLSGIWSRDEAKTVSDLFTNSRHKLQWVILSEMARSQVHKSFLVSYIACHVVDSWHHDSAEFSLKMRWSFYHSFGLQNIAARISEATWELTRQGIRGLEELNEQRWGSQHEMLRAFFSISSLLQFSTPWVPEVIESSPYILKSTSYPSKNSLGAYLVNRARMAAIHRLHNPALWNLAIEEHLAGIEDQSLSDQYIIYSLLFNTRAKGLERENLRSVLEEGYLKSIWKPGLASYLTNKYLADLCRPWHADTYDLARYVLVIASALKSFRSTGVDVFRKEPRSLLNVKNAIRYIRRRDAEGRSRVNLRTMKNSKQILHIMDLLERNPGVI